MTTFFFVLSLLGKTGNQLQVADDASGIIKILTVTDRTFHKAMLADVSTSFAQGVVDIESEVAAAGLYSGVQQKKILFLGQMLVQIDVAGAAAVEVSGEGSAM